MKSRGGPHSAGGVAVFVSTVFNGTAISSEACRSHPLNMERKSTFKNYFHGVATFTVSCCLCLKVFEPKLVLRGRTFEPGDERSWCFVSHAGSCVPFDLSTVDPGQDMTPIKNMKLNFWTKESQNPSSST